MQQEEGARYATFLRLSTEPDMQRSAASRPLQRHPRLPKPQPSGGSVVRRREAAAGEAATAGSLAPTTPMDGKFSERFYSFNDCLGNKIFVRSIAVLCISSPGSEAKPNQHTHNSTEITIGSKNVPNLHVLMYNQTLLDKCVLSGRSNRHGNPTQRGEC